MNKFRVWDIEDKKMIYKFNCERYKLSHIDGELRFVLEGFVQAEWHYVIMQSIGKPDKSGVEIYAGDVITHTETSPYGGWWDGIVSWQEEGSMGWCVEPLPRDKGRGRYGMNYCHVLEILGNKWENPDLLGETK